MSAEAEEKKGYVKPTIILTYVSEIDLWFRMWVQYLVEWLKIRLMKCWQYVCGIPWCKLLKPDLYFLKDKMVRF